VCVLLCVLLKKKSIHEKKSICTNLYIECNASCDLFGTGKFSRSLDDVCVCVCVCVCTCIYMYVSVFVYMDVLIYRGCNASWGLAWRRHDQ